MEKQLNAWAMDTRSLPAFGNSPSDSTRWYRFNAMNQMLFSWKEQQQNGMVITSIPRSVQTVQRPLKEKEETIDRWARFVQELKPVWETLDVLRWQLKQRGEWKRSRSRPRSYLFYRLQQAKLPPPINYVLNVYFAWYPSSILAAAAEEVEEIIIEMENRLGERK